ncbi:hypothetical protein RDI58_015192 [Solanum bulbocastanum]|uniref:Uncharacterized protein n=1 Tax=Solanum bulbocastanum TaxID=147425 RepID=A0AAN8TKF2_SOLBU
MGKETTVAIFVIFLCVVTATAYDYSGINQEASKTITNRFSNIIVKTPTTSHEHPMHKAAPIIPKNNDGTTTNRFGNTTSHEHPKHDGAPIIPENNGGSSTLRNSDIFV